MRWIEPGVNPAPPTLHAMKRRGPLFGTVVFLLCAGALLVANPLFWDILNMEFGASTYTVVEADGAARAVVHGPKGPWPAWAPAPEGGAVAPVVSYSAAPGHPAQGFGDAPIKAAPLAAARAMKAALEAEGWAVVENHIEGAEPTIPPRRLVMCVLRAEQGVPPSRTLLYVFQTERPLQSARIHWIEGEPLPAWISPSSAC